jgi:serine beta-lactamase-like protein LACTB, mitochondrial
MLFTHGASRRDLMLAASALTAAAAHPARAFQSNAAAAARADTVAQRLLAANPAPALSVAAARPGGLVWAKAYGKADLQLDVAATPAHSFGLGSVSKVVTAAAAARLVTRGVIDLDAPIVRWLPDLPAQHRQTTLRQLFTHRGGIRHYDLPRDLGPKAPGGPIGQRIYPTNREILDIFVNDPLVGPPGAQIAYSSYGYTLASIVMETAAKQPFLEIVKTEVGGPFGLASLEGDDPFTVKPRRVSGYTDAKLHKSLGYPMAKDGWANARQGNPAYKWAAGGLIMTASDMAKFGAAHLESPSSAITPAERALLFTPMTEKAGNMPPLGLAWRIDADEKGRLRWHHAGSDEGSRASLVVYPGLGLSIALATNLFAVPGNVLRPSSELADALA